MPQCWSPGASHPTPLCSEPRNSCCHRGRLAISSLLEAPLCSSCPLSPLELGSLTFRKQFTVSKALSCPLLNSSQCHSPSLRAVSRRHRPTSQARGPRSREDEQLTPSHPDSLCQSEDGRLLARCPAQESRGGGGAVPACEDTSGL